MCFLNFVVVCTDFVVLLVKIFVCVAVLKLLQKRLQWMGKIDLLFRFKLFIAFSERCPAWYDGRMWKSSKTFEHIVREQLRPTTAHLQCLHFHVVERLPLFQTPDQRAPHTFSIHVGMNTLDQVVVSVSRLPNVLGDEGFFPAKSWKCKFGSDLVLNPV
jgi:hypothetical protein